MTAYDRQSIKYLFMPTNLPTNRLWGPILWSRGGGIFESVCFLGGKLQLPYRSVEPEITWQWHKNNASKCLTTTIKGSKRTHSCAKIFLRTWCKLGASPSKWDPPPLNSNVRLCIQQGFSSLFRRSFRPVNCGRAEFKSHKYRYLKFMSQ